MTEQDVYEAIRSAHAPPEWACFRDVADSTGNRHRRRADAVALNLWPSRGLEVRGFEIKVSRSDAVREFLRPAKAEQIARFCHTWWVATPAKLFADHGRMPMGWGLMEVSDKGVLRVVKQATVRPDAEVEVPSRLFIASLARAAHTEIVKIGKEYVRRDEIAEEIDAAYKRGAADAPREQKFAMQDLERKVAGARPILATLGINIDSSDWGPDRLDAESGKSYAAALTLGRAFIGRYSTGVPHAVTHVQDAVRQLRDVEKRLQQLLDKEKAG
jgi:hypothetical protein